MQHFPTVLDAVFNREGFGERAGTLGLKTVAASAEFPIIPSLKDGTGSIAAMGREADPARDLPGVEGEDGGEPRFTAAPEAKRAIHLGGISELWLMESPEGELRWGDPRALEATLVLVDGWASTVIHRLAVEPLTLAGLDRAIPDLDREEIEPCLRAMQRSGQLESRPGAEGEQVYALTEWGREAVASLIAAARLERVSGEGEPIEDIDVQAVFALALSLARLRVERSGTCALTVDLGAEGEPRPCGGTARFEDGRLAAWSSEVAEAPDARAWGGVDGWFRAVVEARLDGLGADGDTCLATSILEALHERLFAIDE